VVEVFSNSTTHTWHLEIRGDGDFTPTISLDQLYIAPDGTTPPAEGTPTPPSPWTPLSTTFQELNSGQKTNGWAHYNKDFIFQAQADDEPVSSATRTLFFRLWAQ